MFWKVMFWLTMALLTIVVFGGAMAIAGGGVMCTFDLGIWKACFEFAGSMLFLRIVVPILVITGVVKLVAEFQKKHR